MLSPCTSVLVPTRTIIPHSDRLWRTLLSLVRRFRYSSAVAIIYTRSVCFLYEIHKTIIVDLVKHPIVISSRLERGKKTNKVKTKQNQKMKQNKSISMNSIQLKSVVLDQPTGNIWLNCLAFFAVFFYYGKHFFSHYDSARDMASSNFDQYSHLSNRHSSTDDVR